MRDALTITSKDLRLLARDRRALVILIALPLVIIAIVGSSTGSMTRSAGDRPTVLHVEFADFRPSEISERLRGFLAAGERVVVHPRRPDAEQQAEGVPRFLESGVRPPAVTRVVVGPAFASSLAALSTAELLSLGRSRPLVELSAVDVHVTDSARADPLSVRLTEVLVQTALADAVGPLVTDRTAASRDAADSSPPPPAWSESGNAAEAVSSDPRIYQFVVPGYTVLFVFFLVTIMGRSFIGERDLGTLRRLRISPVSGSSILVGKTLPFLIVSVVQTLILMVSGRLLFGMSWGAAPWLLLPVIVCTSLAATTLGLWFATIVRTDAQVSSFGNLLVLSTAGISGCLVPRDWMPEFSQRISLITPHAWALDAYSELLTHDRPDPIVIALRCGVLLLFSAAFFALGLRRFLGTT